MIIDTFRPDPEGPDHIYKRWRDAEGNLIEEVIEDFKPYFWIRASTPNRIVDRILNRYPGSSVDWYDRSTALRSEEELVKVYAYRPGDVRDMVREFGQTWEGDLSLVDQYLIDSIDEMPEWKPRVWHFDLEWDPKEDFTTVMAVTDNYNERNVVFCWSEGANYGARHMGEVDENGLVSKKDIEVDNVDEDGIQHRFTYERHLYMDEESMYQAFFSYLEECNPDVLVAHAIMWADLPHIIRRFPEFRRLSPLGRVIRPPQGNKGYDYTAQPIIGRLCFDTAAPLRSGTGFERVWKDSGQPQLRNLKLNTIAETLGYGGKFEMDVFTGWYERFDDYVDYCMQDVLLLKKIDENNHVLNFFFSLQRICGVSFPSCHNVTRFARGLLSRRTEWKAPTRSQQEKAEYEGAFIPPPKPGRYEGVACVDYKGLYPSLILSHNLSWESQVPRNRAKDKDVHELPDGTCWQQGEPALLPRIVTEMFELRDKYKGLMKSAETETERKGWNTMQLAVKRVMASFYGMTASAHWGWCDFDIASAITACGRQSIVFLMEESEAQGYEALYGHTDSAFVKVPFDEAPALAKHLTDEVQRRFKANALFVEFEAYMPYWIVGGKNLYYGICSWPPEDEGKVKSARWGKISTLAPISKNLENDVLTAICTGADEEETISITRPLAKRIMKGNVDLKDITGNMRIQKRLSQYAPTIGLSGIKGARYYNQHIAKGKGDKLDEGDSVNWVYVSRVPDGQPGTDVVAYREAEDLEGYDLNYSKMVDMLVKKKVQKIFEAMEWNLEFATGAARPKRYW